MLSADNRRILRQNMLMLLGGAVVFGVLAKFTGGASLAFFGLQILLQALANAALGLLDSFGQTQGKAAGYWLSALLVLIIGPGACGAAAGLMM